MFKVDEVRRLCLCLLLDAFTDLRGENVSDFVDARYKYLSQGVKAPMLRSGDEDLGGAWVTGFPP
jgi:hypothetical protein